jgi:small ligand-binding sensory domain FIST
VGAVASGGTSAGQNALFVDGELHREGAVGVALLGAVALDVVVSQGCRPVGHPLRVTAVQGPLVLELDGEPALTRFQHLFQQLDDRTRKLFQVQPMVGVAMDPSGPVGAGDYLIRHIAGVDPKKHGIAIGHPMALGDVVQFHVRDAAASTEDLHELLGRHVQQHGAAEGVLLFSCLGRGERFYRKPDVDSRTVRELLGDVALGGIFANGEIGAVHGRTFLHGYAAALGVFRTPDWN